MNTLSEYCEDYLEDGSWRVISACVRLSSSGDNCLRAASKSSLDCLSIISLACSPLSRCSKNSWNTSSVDNQDDILGVTAFGQIRLVLGSCIAISSATLEFNGGRIFRSVLGALTISTQPLLHVEIGSITSSSKPSLHGIFGPIFF